MAATMSTDPAARAVTVAVLSTPLPTIVAMVASLVVQCQTLGATRTVAPLASVATAATAQVWPAARRVVEAVTAMVAMVVPRVNTWGEAVVPATSVKDGEAPTASATPTPTTLGPSAAAPR